MAKNSPLRVLIPLIIAAAIALALYMNLDGPGKNYPDESSKSEYIAIKMKAHSKSIISSPKETKKINIQALKKMLKDEGDSFPGTLSVVIHDFETGASAELNADETMESASLVKLPLMLEVFRLIDEGKLAPERTLQLTDSYKTGGAGRLKNEKSGTYWTVEKLAELMITVSDNTAADMLIDLASMEAVEKTCIRIGMKNTTLKRKIYDFERIDHGFDNLTTARDICAFYRILYEGPYISPKSRAKMINILKKQTRRNIIPKLLPKEASCAHKTGGLLGIVHDGGMVYKKNRKPYIIVLMSENVADETTAAARLAEISLKTYRLME